MKTLFLFTKKDELKQKYTEYAERHNVKAMSSHPDAGFDLFLPEDIWEEDYQIKIDTEIIVAMIDENNVNCSFYLYPRSSIYKTNLRLANSVGIIDSGYRGNIIGMFDNMYCTAHSIEKIDIKQYSRLMQICSGDLRPFTVQIVDDIQLLGSTERGIGGFGSTGI